MKLFSVDIESNIMNTKEQDLLEKYLDLPDNRAYFDVMRVTHKGFILLTTLEDYHCRLCQRTHSEGDERDFMWYDDYGNLYYKCHAGARRSYKIFDSRPKGVCLFE